VIYNKFINRLEKRFLKMKNYLKFFMMVLLELYRTKFGTELNFDLSFGSYERFAKAASYYC